MSKSVKVICIGAAVQDVFLMGKIFKAQREKDDYVQEFELGTKNEVADQIWQLNLKADLAYRLASVYDPSLFRNIGIDNVASVINDLSAVGAIPTNFALFIATSSSSWFKDQGKTNALIQGTVEGCNIAKCSWGNGETQTLRGPIADGHFVLAGSANGLVFPNHNGKMNSENLTEGDDITLFASSGPHTNGITFLRNEVAPRLTNVYETLLSDGKTYAEALLTPTKIYAPLIDALYNSQIRIKYASPITGHGWRKIMRADRNDLIYVIDQIPATLPIFEKVQEVTRMSDQQMYSDFNMGIGFAIMTEYYYTDRLHRIAEKAGFKIAGVGHIESGPKKVVIVPLGIELTDLNIR